MFMREASFLKLSNVCLGCHLSKLTLFNQKIMKINEFGMVNPCHNIWSILRCLFR